MRYQVLSYPSLPIGTHTLTPWSPVWARWNDTIGTALVEAALSACSSPSSRLYGRAALRELDALLRRDVGLIAVPPDAVLSIGFEGLR